MNGELGGVLAACAAVSSTAFSVLGYRRKRSAELVAAGQTDPRGWSMWRVLVRPLARGIEPKGADLTATIERLQPAGRAGREEVRRFSEERALGIILGLVFGVAAGFVIP